MLLAAAGGAIDCKMSLTNAWHLQPWTSPLYQWLSISIIVVEGVVL